MDSCLRWSHLRGWEENVNQEIQAFVWAISLTSPDRASSHTSQFSRSPRLTMTLRVPATLQRPFGVQDWWADSASLGKA